MLAKKLLRRKHEFVESQAKGSSRLEKEGPKGSAEVERG